MSKNLKSKFKNLIVNLNAKAKTKYREVDLKLCFSCGRNCKQKWHKNLAKIRNIIYQTNFLLVPLKALARRAAALLKDIFVQDFL